MSKFLWDSFSEETAEARHAREQAITVLLRDVAEGDKAKAQLAELQEQVQQAVANENILNEEIILLRKRLEDGGQETQEVHVSELEALREMKDNEIVAERNRNDELASRCAMLQRELETANDMLRKEQQVEESLRQRLIDNERASNVAMSEVKSEAQTTLASLQLAIDQANAKRREEDSRVAELKQQMDAQSTQFEEVSKQLAQSEQAVEGLRRECSEAQSAIQVLTRNEKTFKEEISELNADRLLLQHERDDALQRSEVIATHVHELDAMVLSLNEERVRLTKEIEEREERAEELQRQLLVAMIGLDKATHDAADAFKRKVELHASLLRDLMEAKAQLLVLQGSVLRASASLREDAQLDGVMIAPAAAATTTTTTDGIASKEDNATTTTHTQ